MEQSGRNRWQSVENRSAPKTALTGQTATFTSRGFESAINRRLATTAPFALLVGEPCEHAPPSLRRAHLDRDDCIRELSRPIGGHAGETDELAHLGETTFAVLTSAGTPTQARAGSVALEITCTQQDTR